MRSLVQPLLWRTFHPKDGGVQFLERNPALAAHIRSVEGYGVPKLTLDLVNRTARKAPQLETIKFEGDGTINTISGKNLANLPGASLYLSLPYPSLILDLPAGVKHLTLSRVRLFCWPSPLFYLVSLSLINCKIKRLHTDSPLLTPTYMSHLRALYTTAIVDSTLLDFPLLHPQLEILQIRYKEHKHFSTNLQHSAAPILLSFELDEARKLGNSAFAHFQHFHLSSDDTMNDRTEFQSQRTRFASFVTDLVELVLAHPGMTSLSLPSHFLPKNPLPSQVAIARANLLIACEAQGITIVWRRLAKTRVDDLDVCKEVWDYLR